MNGGGIKERIEKKREESRWMTKEGEYAIQKKK